MPRVVLRRKNLLRLCEDRAIDPTTTALGARIGVHHSQVSRVLSGKSEPGNRFIAGILDVFGVGAFQDLFAIVPDAVGDDA
jgi:transcriptional regulator with XRE-family HTH domain